MIARATIAPAAASCLPGKIAHRGRAIIFYYRRTGIGDARERRHASATGAEVGFDDPDAGQGCRQSDVAAQVPDVGLKPMEAPLSEVADVTVDTSVDRASGVEICHIMVVMRTGAGWALPAMDKQDAQTKATAIRAFLGLA